MTSIRFGNTGNAAFAQQLAQQAQTSFTRGQEYGYTHSPWTTEGVRISETIKNYAQAAVAMNSLDRMV